MAAPAIGAPNKGYTVDVDGVAVAGTNASFTVTFDAPAKQSLGSAQLTVPEGFTVVSVAADAPASTVVSGGTVTLNGLEIAAGGSEDVTVNVAVPCTGSDATWESSAKQANEYNGTGNNLQLDTSGSSLTTAITGVCAPCPEDEICDASLPNGNKSFKVTGLPNAAADEGVLTLALGSSLQIDCAGYQETMTATALFNVTGDREKIATLTVPKREMPKSSPLQLCFGAPDPFPGSVPQGSYDWDGNGTDEPVYVGLLPDCSATVTTRCVFNRDRLKPSGDGIIEARLPAGDPGMRG
ncbi:MAG TPA: hypothetical protein VD836_14555 [Solirubrobacteraceae bacterium]|nr:hypothetical protein [Solirubrobacteraceae bacterium]